MGQCYARPRLPRDFARPSDFAGRVEGALYSLHNKEGPLTIEEQAIDELLGPLFQLTLEARFGYQLCLHVFTALTRVAKLILVERPDGPPLAVRLARLREVAWGVEELLANFSSRGWLLRLVCTSRLDALVRWRLEDLSELEADLSQPGSGLVAGTHTSSSTGPPSDSDSDFKGAKQLAAGLRSARKLQETLVTHLPSVMAPHGGAGDPSAMENFMRRITPLVQGGDHPLRQLELHEEVQIAVASLSVGPHRALRHPDLQYFWWRHMAGLEEVPWSTLWPHLANFLSNTPRLSDGAGDTGAALELLRSNEMVRRLQSAVHRMGYANYVNAAELDMAFGSGSGSGGCMTLEEQLRVLLRPGRPILLARTSKGTRAEGWAREAAAAAVARQAAMAAEAAARTSRRATTAAAAAVMAARQVAAATDGGADEEDRWYDAGSNFSRATSSTYMSVLAGALDDTSSIWQGRPNFSRPVSQVYLVAAGNTPSSGSRENSPPTTRGTHAGNAGPFSRSRASSREPRGGPIPQPAAGEVFASRRSSATQLVPSGAPAGSRVPSAGGAPVVPAADKPISAAAAEAAPPEVTPAGEQPLGEQADAVSPAAAFMTTDLVHTGSQVDQGGEQTPRDAQLTSHTHAGPSGSAGLVRLLGRDEDLRCLIDAIFSCGVGVNGAASATVLTPDAPQQEDQDLASRPSSPQQQPMPAVLLVTAPPGCGRTALVTAAADRLVEAGVWNCASFADVRCAAGPEEAALAMGLALNVPFYATDRPAGARLLSWLRTYGPQLRQGLVLDNVDMLLGLGRDEALEVARTGSPAPKTPVPSAGGAPAAQPHGPSPGPLAVKQLEGYQPYVPRVTEPSAASDMDERRRRLLRLLRDVVLAAPGLRLVMISGPGVTPQLLQPSLPLDLFVGFHSFGQLPAEAAAQILRGTLLAARRSGAGTSGGGAGGDNGGSESQQLVESQIRDIVEASDKLPGLLRLSGRAVRCGTLDLARIANWAADALRHTRARGGEDVSTAAVDVFAAQLVPHIVSRLPPDARAVLFCMVALGCPLEEEDVTAAVAFLGHPGLVRAGLCCLYDRGLLTFQDLSQRHDVVGHVRRWILRAHTSSLVAPESVASSPGSTPRVSPRDSGSSPKRRTGQGSTHSLGGAPSATGSSASAGSETGGRFRRRSSGLPRFGSAGAGQNSSLGGAKAGSHAAMEAGLRLRVLVQHLDELLGQVGELYANGCRVAALRLYNNSRGLADRALLLLPAWIRRAGSSCSAGAAFAQVMSRHLNNICRHVLLPSQLSRVSLDLADLVSQLTSPYDRLASFVTAARAHVHLMALQPAGQQLAAADSLALKLFPTLGTLLEGNHEKAAKDQVAQLALAHAEHSAASGKYDLAVRHLETFLELLAVAGRAQSLEGAQARMQLGDLFLRLSRPPAEAAAHYDAAATMLMQLYGQGHFRVGRAMLAAARCSPELQPELQQQQQPGRSSGGGAERPPGKRATSGGSGGGLLGLGKRASAGPRRPLEAQLQDCLYVQHLSQGKFNLDVAEVEVARGVALCRRNHPDEALSCGLVALAIVLEILGDGTPQVAECLALVAQALRQKHRPAAAAAVTLHAHAVRLHAVAVIAAASDMSNSAAVARPPPTESVVLENLVDPALVQELARLTSFSLGLSAHQLEAPQPALPLPVPESPGPEHAIAGLETTPVRRAQSLLHRSPIVQVPLPDIETGSPTRAAAADDGSMASPVPSAGVTPPAHASPMLRPSPRLVVLVPGEDVPMPSPRTVGEITPIDEESPAVDDGAYAAGAAARGVVRHVAYSPPLVPVDSMPVGMGDAMMPSPSSPVLSPRGIAARTVRHVSGPPPLAPIDSMPVGYGDALVTTPVQSPPQASVDSGRAESAAGLPPSAPEPPCSPQPHPAEPPVRATSMSGSPCEPGEGAVATAASAGGAFALAFGEAHAALTGQPASKPHSSGGFVARLNSTATDVWEDAPEDSPDVDVAAVEVEVPPVAAAAAEVPAATEATGVAVAPGLTAEEPSFTVAAATAAAAQDEQADEESFTLAKRKPAAPALSSQSSHGSRPAGLQLPFPPPRMPSATASAAAPAFTAAPADGWSTPVRARMSEPAVPHLHPSPTTMSFPRHTSVGGSATSSTHPFSPDLSLPPPPPHASAAPPPASTAVIASIFGGTVTAAAVATTTADEAVDDPNTSGLAQGNREATPMAQLSYTAFSPSASHGTQDSRTHRGGIVFPSPTSTPGPAHPGAAIQQAPWLTWANGGVSDSSPDTPTPRELRFADGEAAAAAVSRQHPHVASMAPDCDVGAGVAPRTATLAAVALAASTAAVVQSPEAESDAGVVSEAGKTTAPPDPSSAATVVAEAEGAVVLAAAVPVADIPAVHDEADAPSLKPAALSEVLVPAPSFSEDIPAAETRSTTAPADATACEPAATEHLAAADETCAASPDSVQAFEGAPDNAPTGQPDTAEQEQVQSGTDVLEADHLRELSTLGASEREAEPSAPGAPSESGTPGDEDAGVGLMQRADDGAVDVPAPAAGEAAAHAAVAAALSVSIIPGDPGRVDGLQGEQGAAPEGFGGQPPPRPHDGQPFVRLSADSRQPAAAAEDGEVEEGAGGTEALPITESPARGLSGHIPGEEEAEQQAQPTVLPVSMASADDAAGAPRAPVPQFQQPEPSHGVAGLGVAACQREYPSHEPERAAAEQRQALEGEPVALAPVASVASVPHAYTPSASVTDEPRAYDSLAAADLTEGVLPSGSGAPAVGSQEEVTVSQEEAAASQDLQETAAAAGTAASHAQAPPALDAVADTSSDAEADAGKSGTLVQASTAAAAALGAVSQPRALDEAGGPGSLELPAPEHHVVPAVEEDPVGAVPAAFAAPVASALEAAQAHPEACAQPSVPHSPAGEVQSESAFGEAVTTPGNFGADSWGAPEEPTVAQPCAGWSSGGQEAVSLESAADAAPPEQPALYAAVTGLSQGGLDATTGSPERRQSSNAAEQVAGALVDAETVAERMQAPGTVPVVRSVALEAAAAELPAVPSAAPAEPDAAAAAASEEASGWVQPQAGPAMGEVSPLAALASSSPAPEAAEEAFQAAPVAAPDLVPSGAAAVAAAAEGADKSSKDPAVSSSDESMPSHTPQPRAQFSRSGSLSEAGPTPSRLGSARKRSIPLPPGAPTPHTAAKAPSSAAGDASTSGHTSSHSATPGGTPLALSRASSFVTPAPKRPSASGIPSVFGPPSASASALATPSATKPSASSAARIPLPPMDTTTTSTRSRSFRIPTPTGTSGFTVAPHAITAVRNSTFETPAPNTTASEARARPPYSAAQQPGTVASGAQGPPSAWTLYSSPAFAMQDATTSPHTDGEASPAEVHEVHGDVSSPAARVAGSYTAAYLMRQKRRSGTSWGGAAPTPDGFQPSAGVATSPTDPRVPQGIKVHNPLFVSNSPPHLGANGAVFHPAEDQDDSSGEHHHHCYEAGSSGDGGGGGGGAEYGSRRRRSAGQRGRVQSRHHYHHHNGAHTYADMHRRLSGSSSSDDDRSHQPQSQPPKQGGYSVEGGQTTPQGPAAPQARVVSSAPPRRAVPRSGGAGSTDQGAGGRSSAAGSGSSGSARHGRNGSGDKPEVKGPVVRTGGGYRSSSGSISSSKGEGVGGKAAGQAAPAPAAAATPVPASRSAAKQPARGGRRSSGGGDTPPPVWR